MCDGIALSKNENDILVKELNHGYFANSKNLNMGSKVMNDIKLRPILGNRGNICSHGFKFNNDLLRWKHSYITLRFVIN